MSLSPKEIFSKASLGKDLEQLKQVVNTKDQNDYNKTTLHKAIIEGNLNMVKALILLGAELDTKADEYGHSDLTKKGLVPLHFAVIYKRTNIVKYLIKMGAPIETKDSEGRTPLHYAPNVEVAKVLFEKGANIEARDDEERTPLHMAALHALDTTNKNNTAKYLIDMGAQIEVKTKYGETPLHLVVEDNFLEMVKYLIERGARLDTRMHKYPYYGSETPFDLADRREHFEIAKYLLEKKSELEPQKAANNVSDQAPCIICLVPRNGIFAFDPCGHASLCELCCYKLKYEEDPKCPSCREPIENYKKIFFQEPE